MSLNKVLIAIGILILLVGAVFFFTYNGLVSAEEDVDAKWYDVEIQYQRRVDLIPNLIETVKGYAAHEEKVFTEITKYRSQWSAATTPEERVEAANGMESTLSRLVVVVENYPDLKASDSFKAFQAQLEGTENRIAVARMRYNEKVRDYNTQLKKIPSSMIAGMIGSEPKAYFEAEKGAQEAPKVKFNQPGTTTSPSPTPQPTVVSASVNLYGEKTDVVLGEDILLKLSVVNLRTKPRMHLQVIIMPPSGMSVTSSEFSTSVTGQCTANYELEPGDNRNIEVNMRSNHVGDFIVNGRVIYHFGNDQSTEEDHTLELPIKVRSVKKPI